MKKEESTCAALSTLFVLSPSAASPSTQRSGVTTQQHSFGDEVKKRLVITI